MATKNEKAWAEYNAYILAKYGHIPTITEYFASKSEVTVCTDPECKECEI